MRKKCQNKKENDKECPCQEIECENHGLCCQCISYHRKHKDKPACMR